MTIEELARVAGTVEAWCGGPLSEHLTQGELQGICSKIIPLIAAELAEVARDPKLIDQVSRGLTPLQIEDFVGMSHAMIARYCRFADKKKSGKAAAETLQKGRQGVTSVTAKATKRRI